MVADKTKILVLLLLICTSIRAQVSIEKDTIVTYKPTSPDFIPLKMQTHKGLLRFGYLNPYTFTVNGKEDATQKKEEKRAQINASMTTFEHLLILKQLSEHFKDIDREKFTLKSSSMYVEEKNSFLAQSYLLKIASMTAGPKIIQDYFCNDTKIDCDKLIVSHKYGGVYYNYWGGKQANEFRKLAKYKSYTNKYLDKLQQWSNALFKDTNEKAYLVLALRLGTYDFENEGYWLNTRESISHSRFLRFSDFEPAKVENRKLANLYKSKLLYKISTDKAEKFRADFNVLYLVLHVNVSLKGLSYGKDRLLKKFSLESSKITVYSDESLTKKITELPIASLKMK